MRPLIIATLFFQAGLTFVAAILKSHSEDSSLSTASEQQGKIIIHRRRSLLRRRQAKRQLDLISGGDGEQLNILRQNDDILSFFNSYYISDLDIKANDRSRNANMFFADNTIRQNAGGGQDTDEEDRGRRRQRS